MNDSAARSTPVILPVSLLVSSARLLLERQIGLVWVGGEVSNFMRATSGHCYFVLKDSAAQVRCVLWRSKAQALEFPLRDGMAVEVRATPTMYEPRGEFQLNVDHVRQAGLGALFERFARLKAKLDAAGWFAETRKRPLPAHPRIVGVVTSPRAAALSDVLTTLARRWPALRVIVYPAPVQGAGAAEEIASAIRLANARAEVDVLIVCRGGGSIEDLWAYNEEALARAVFESALPLVSGVGHETDFTICDFVADVRAPTPTGAAALVAPDRAAYAQRIAAIVARATRTARHRLATQGQRLDAASRGLIHPAARLAAQRVRGTELAERLAAAWRRQSAQAQAATAAAHAQLARELRAPLPQWARVAAMHDGWRRAGRDRVLRAGERVRTLAQNLAHLNPQGVLARGYAIVATPDGAIVHDARQLTPGDDVALQFALGKAGARVTKVEPA